jgi:hypothetical protein
MKVWICKTFYCEDNPNEFQIAHVFDSEEKAIKWKAKHAGDYVAYEEYEVE